MKNEKEKKEKLFYKPEELRKEDLSMIGPATGVSVIPVWQEINGEVHKNKEVPDFKDLYKNDN